MLRHWGLPFVGRITHKASDQLLIAVLIIANWNTWSALLTTNKDITLPKCHNHVKIMIKRVSGWLPCIQKAYIPAMSEMPTNTPRQQQVCSMRMPCAGAASAALVGSSSRPPSFLRKRTTHLTTQNTTKLRLFLDFSATYLIIFVLSTYFYLSSNCGVQTLYYLFKYWEQVLYYNFTIEELWLC